MSAATANGASDDHKEARELVEKIARSHGYVPAEMLAAMEPQVRLVVEEALRNKDDMIASSVFTLARNLYTSNARFIFELLQNADDNHYTKAQAAGEAPFITFRVYHNMLIVECNEDGFTEENLRAICNIGKSSKHGAQGYIGEKGIGFKSTFIAAWKVQIQSGPFSFYFQHRVGDSGMGMITPIWFESKVEFTRPLTRIFLHFHDTGETEDLQRRRDDIIKQLRDLQGTFLLFLKNLQVINIMLFNQDRKRTWTRETTMKKDVHGNSAWLNIIEREGTSSKTTSHRFHLTTHLAQELPKNENRTYDKVEEETKAYSTAQVVIAFPLDDSNVPVIEAQELFAFMPVRKVGFTFLIQADFVTQANRQDIVTTSDRNIKLRQAIGDAFVRGVQQLCMQPNLQYKWMRYLPRKETLPLDPFWKDLVNYISEALREKPILRPRSDHPSKLYKIAELGRLNGEQLDKDGNPLFPDLPVEKYLSVAYTPTDLDVLGDYGLQSLQMDDIMPRMQAFVTQPGWQSKTYEDRDEDWHSRVAVLIMQAWEDKGHDWKGKLRSMPLLPLRSVLFQSATSNDPKVFFPDIESILIPQDINLPMILPAAAANPDCRKLYEALGVTSADPARIRRLIIEKHDFWSETALDITISRNHLRYLYQMESYDKIDGDEQYKIVVFDHLERAKHPRREYVYLPGEGEWSPAKLLRTSEGTDFQELDVSFIHPEYLQDPPLPQGDYAKIWNDWLYEVAWVEEKVQIFSKRDNDTDKTDEGKTFSEEWLFLAQHQSGKVIDRFHQNWLKPEVRQIWEGDDFGTSLARELEVLCADGDRHPLQGTFLPLPSLLTRCESLLANANAIPFISLESPLQDGDAHEWAGFGKHFGIGVSDDLDFSLTMLRAIIYVDSKTKDPLTQTVRDLYLRIHVQCLASEDKESAQKKVREFFAENCGVLCSPLPLNSPSEDETVDPDWALPNKCLWDAPAHMTVAVPLKPLWEPIMVTLGLQDRENLEQFFRHTLQIRDVTDREILEELVDLSEFCEVDEAYSPQLEFIRGLYQRLDRLRNGMDESNLSAIKEAFEEKRLIYAPSGQPKRWLKVSECVWSGEGVVLGKAFLEPLYPDLPGLFMDYLRIPKLSFELAYQELIEIGGSTPAVLYVKNLLWSLKVLLPHETKIRPAFGDEAALCRAFPVRMPDGSVQLLTAREDFAIIDRQHYATALKNRIKILDFTMDEVRRLRHLIKWAGLTDRYLSRSVVEQTVVDDTRCVEDRRLARDLARKAGAFVSIAAHFGSPLVSTGPETLHSTLRSTIVFIAETFTSTLLVVQDGKEVVTPIGNSELHIEVSDIGGLEIYIPTDEGARDFCVASMLPRGLAACLLKCKLSAVKPHIVSVVGSIIHAKPTSIGRILEANGITELNLPPHDEDDDIDDETNPNQGIRARSGPGNPVTPAATPHRHMSNGYSHFGNGNETIRSPSLFHQTGNDQYRLLLVQIVEVARGMRFPDQNSTFDMSALAQTFQEESAIQKSFKFYVGDQTEWRRMVGAAGELFVFEVLSGLSPSLPNFGHANWQSTVRRYVKAHPDYSTLDPWEGSETSDIFYSDDSGVLTTTFIEKGYLDEAWKGEKPDYFIEVKTTMLNNLETPFYLSKHQYSRMQNLSGGGARLPHLKKKIYALFRVYGLESGRVGVKVYIDPEMARKDGQLEFEADGWTVTPRTRTGTPTQTQGATAASGETGTAGRFGVSLDFGRTVMPVFRGSPSA